MNAWAWGRINDLIGNLKSLNELARLAHADYIIHTGDFGFYDENSIDGIADKYGFLHKMIAIFHTDTKLQEPLNTLHNTRRCCPRTSNE